MEITTIIKTSRYILILIIILVHIGFGGYHYDKMNSF